MMDETINKITHVNFKNAGELKKLVKTAEKQLNQLNGTLDRINAFELEITTQADGQCNH